MENSTRETEGEREREREKGGGGGISLFPNTVVIFFSPSFPRHLLKIVLGS